MGLCGYFLASLRQRSCSSQYRYRSINAVTKMHCCSERKTAFMKPFCIAHCSANKSLKQRCFNVFCIIRAHIQGNFSAFHSTYHSAYRYTVKENNEALSSENHLSLELKRLSSQGRGRENKPKAKQARRKNENGYRCMM